MTRLPYPANALSQRVTSGDTIKSNGRINIGRFWLAISQNQVNGTNVDQNALIRRF
jgi:hypothetical protein